MTDYYLSTKDLTVGYNGVPLIKDIRINVEKGEIVTLIGPNGSGKSTILKSITKHLKTLAGDTEIDGNSVAEISYKNLSKILAIVLTDRIRPELMTCRDIVETGRYPYTGGFGILDENDNRVVNEAMAKVHAEDLAEKEFLSCSDGQKQRILLARAICQEPDIIVLDEPTSFLDIKHKLELLNILRTMAKEKGITVVMSLHEIDLAQKISDKIVCVKGETIPHMGVPDEIFTKEIISDLYNIDSGSYNIMFGSVELPKVTGRPEVFVISSSGNGIPVYRELQKLNIPFAAGVLYKNDIDYQVAEVLASEVIYEKPFCTISKEKISEAEKVIDSCRYVVDAGIEEGEFNKRIADLAEYGKKQGKLTTPDDLLNNAFL